MEPTLLHQLSTGDTIYANLCFPDLGWFTTLLNPIQDRESLLGFLHLSRSATEEFSTGEILLSQQIANQCAIAIRQARLYQTTQQQVRDLEALNTLKDEFVHMVSHELRTPLTNMKMAIRMVETEATTERQARYLNILNTEWQRELELANNLLDLIALESGTKTPEVSTRDLEDWLQALLEPFQLRCEEKDQHLEILTMAASYPFSTDYSLMAQILSELLNNACKYTPGGEWICFQVSPQNTHLQFQVRNTGVEISEEQLVHLFDKFYRVSQSNQPKQSGTGLGLALVKKSVELLGGTIHATRDGDALQFTVTLPDLFAHPVNP